MSNNKKLISFSTILIGFQFASLAALIIACVTAPVFKQIGLSSYNGIHYGVFGYCDDTSTCTKASANYHPSEVTSSSSNWKLDDYARSTLGELLIVVPISAGVLFIAMVSNIISTVFSFKANGTSSLIIFIINLILSFLGFAGSAFSCIVCFLLFYPNVTWCSWILIPSAVLALLSLPLTFFIYYNNNEDQEEETASTKDGDDYSSANPVVNNTHAFSTLNNNKSGNLLKQATNFVEETKTVTDDDDDSRDAGTGYASQYYNRAGKSHSTLDIGLSSSATSNYRSYENPYLRTPQNSNNNNLAQTNTLGTESEASSGSYTTEKKFMKDVHATEKEDEYDDIHSLNNNNKQEYLSMINRNGSIRTNNDRVNNDRYAKASLSSPTEAYEASESSSKYSTIPCNSNKAYDPRNNYLDPLSKIPSKPETFSTQILRPNSILERNTAGVGNYTGKRSTGDPIPSLPFDIKPANTASAALDNSKFGHDGSYGINSANSSANNHGGQVPLGLTADHNNNSVIGGDSSNNNSTNDGLSDPGSYFTSVSQRGVNPEYYRRKVQHGLTANNNYQQSQPPQPYPSSAINNGNPYVNSSFGYTAPPSSQQGYFMPPGQQQQGLQQIGSAPLPQQHMMMGYQQSAPPFQGYYYMPQQQKQQVDTSQFLIAHNPDFAIGGIKPNRMGINTTAAVSGKRFQQSHYTPGYKRKYGNKNEHTTNMILNGGGKVSANKAGANGNYPIVGFR
ncbi:SUR7/PalI family protein SCDLUD_003395 [Saccharomycodes ludwigii]|uniref:SUR7/PalI family protein n=1 Tax=Saccharomycodes ludwigii TaxID=36035 RepID=UPI001E847E64|nr:hypothetical protein SCDLUD_003395 [Saccharomycodes ludwigii]KAH3900416.1 hypothetical protein SCDLUD_003395 [Saccharomycodes ludwigii]